MADDKNKYLTKEFIELSVKRMEIRELTSLRGYENNARIHTETQIEEIQNSIRAFGFTNPLLIQGDGTIIAGHGRYEAARRMNMSHIPVINLDYLSPTEAKLLVIADNKIGDNSYYDEEILAKEMALLMEEVDDLSITGFDDIEIQRLMDEFELNLPDDEPAGEPPETPPVIEIPEIPCSTIGDIWILGKHRLICGDSLNDETYKKLMEDKKANLLHTDPPYNVDYSNAARPKASKTDLGKIENDVMSHDEFKDFLYGFYKSVFKVLDKDCAAYIWHSDKERATFHEQAEKAGFKYSQIIIWVKPMLLSRVDYHWAHEPCLYMKKGSPEFIDDRTLTTVWNFGGYDKSNNIHPTQKPVFLPEEAIKNSSRPGSIVLDPFGGSGSTLIACERTGRKCRMIELDPAFVDGIVMRWQEETGDKAILEGVNKTFAHVKKERLANVLE